MKIKLFKNKSENPNAPKLTGYIQNDEGQKLFNVDIWENTSANGINYLSGNVKTHEPKTENNEIK